VEIRNRSRQMFQILLLNRFGYFVEPGVSEEQNISNGHKNTSILEDSIQPSRWPLGRPVLSKRKLHKKEYRISNVE
jgi:hypothetical protein